MSDQPPPMPAPAAEPGQSQLLAARERSVTAERRANATRTVLRTRTETIDDMAIDRLIAQDTIARLQERVDYLEGGGRTLREALRMGATESPTAYLARVIGEAADSARDLERRTWIDALIQLGADVRHPLGLAEYVEAVRSEARAEGAAAERARLAATPPLVQVVGAAGPVTTTENVPAAPGTIVPPLVTITATIPPADAGKLAAEVAKEIDSRRGKAAKPRADRVTTVELARAVRAAADAAKATGGKIHDLAVVFEPFVGRSVVRAKGEEPAIEAEAVEPAPGPEPATPEPMRVISGDATAYPLRWERDATAGDDATATRRLFLLGASRQLIASIVTERFGRTVETILAGREDVPATDAKIAQDPGVERAEATLVDSFAAVIANLTGREVLLGGPLATPAPAATTEPAP